MPTKSIFQQRARKRRPEIRILGGPKIFGAEFAQPTPAASDSRPRNSSPLRRARAVPPPVRRACPRRHRSYRRRRHQPGLSPAGAAISRDHLPPAPPSAGTIFHWRRHQPGPSAAEQRILDGRIHQPWRGKLDKLADAPGRSAASPEHLW
jgi:hypothetical protein